jgi:DNA-binding MarR family transcriptional regulator
MKTFGIVSKKIMTNSDLSLEARALYALLACYCNAERVCFPATATLARLMGRSIPTVYRLLAKLEKVGVISKVRQGRRRIIMLKDREKEPEIYQRKFF